MLRWYDDAGSDAGGEESAPVRVRAVLARVVLVVLVAVATGYAFYLALLWVASKGARRSPGG